MSPSKQIAIIAAMVVVAAGIWAGYGGWLGVREEAVSTTQPPPSGQGGGQAGGQLAARQSGAPGGGGQGGGPGGSPGRGGQAGPAFPVVTAAVETDTTGLEVRAVGTVAAARAVTLYPEATGVVVDLTFRPGALVTAGQPLIRLDDSEQQVAVDRARVALDAAKVALDRSEQLAQSNNIAAATLNDARTAVRGAEIDLRGAELELSRRTLVAPFAGTIGLTDVAVGDLVNSQKAIATLDDMSTVTVAFEVPERASGRVVVGQEIVATTAALAGRSFTGNVTAVDSRVDPVTRTLKVEASLPNEANVLKPGMALNVVLAFPGEAHPAVPSMAVQWDRNGPYVWKVDADTVARVGVDIVGRRSGIVIVAGGALLPGDEVVVEGLQRMRAGVRISRIVEPGGPPPAAPAAGAPEADATAPVRRQPSG